MKYILNVVLGLAVLGAVSCNDSKKDLRSKDCLYCIGCGGENVEYKKDFKPTSQHPTWEAYRDFMIGMNGTWTTWCEERE